MQLRSALLLSAVLPVVASSPASAQPYLEPAMPYKLGTFAFEGESRPGLVLEDAWIVDIQRANAWVQRIAELPQLELPADMLGLIEQYDYGARSRLIEIVNHLTREDWNGATRPEFVYRVGELRTEAPILYPGKILNAAVNFYSHVEEAGAPEERAAARRARRENRGVPYLFLKPGRGAVVGDGGPVVLPWGRNRIDWEVELGAVIGRRAKYVSASDAESYVFGYTITLDISDRGGRPPGGNPLRSDWFVGKGHDTFAPMGPWIVPKEFYGDPMRELHQSLSVGGEQMQEARAGDMIHTLWELIEYGSSISTLYPGDVINNGTSGGVGMGTAVRGKQRFLKPGDVIRASIKGIGTLVVPVVAEDQPEGGTGARLPPNAPPR